MAGTRSSTWRFVRLWWPVAVVGAAVALAAAIAGLALFILASAHGYGRAAQRRFPGDEVQALMATVQSEGLSLAERNHAVWALGQLRDKRALPVLQKYYTGGPCDHAHYLCQSELRKAVDSCSGRTWSLPAWIARTLRLGT
jgi:hypothetical protein